MPSALSRASVIVLGGIASSDPLYCAASWVDSLSPDLVCSKLAPADWLSSLFCDPEGCEPVSPEHPTSRRKAHTISKVPTTVMSHARRTTAHPLSLTCVL